MELAEPLLEEELPEHFAEQTGNESVQEGPVRQVDEEPKLTQQYPVGAELLLPLLDEEETMIELVELLLDDAEDEDVEHLLEQTGKESVQEGPCRHVVEVPTFTQQYPRLPELEMPLLEDDEPKQRSVHTGSESEQEGPERHALVLPARITQQNLSEVELFDEFLDEVELTMIDEELELRED